MADDYSHCNADSTVSQEPKPNVEMSSTLKIRYPTLQEQQEQQEQQEPSSSELQEMVLKPVGLPIDCGNTVSQKTDSVHCLEAYDKADSLVLEERLEKANEEEMTGFEVEKVENGCADAGPVCLNDGVEVKPQLSCGLSENVVLGKEGSSLDMSFAILDNREKGVPVIGERLELNDTMHSWGNTTERALKECSLKIAIIDETALIETSKIGKGFRKDPKISKIVDGQQENDGDRGKKRPRRKGQNGRNKKLGTDGSLKNHKLGHTDCEIGMLEVIVENRRKSVYSRKELEELRHVGLEWQKKEWAEIYSTLEPAVQQEYDGLVDHESHHQHYNQKQNRFIRANCL